MSRPGHFLAVIDQGLAQRISEKREMKHQFLTVACSLIHFLTHSLTHSLTHTLTQKQKQRASRCLGRSRVPAQARAPVH